MVALNVLALLALHFEVIDYFRPAPMQRFNPIRVAQHEHCARFHLLRHLDAVRRRAHADRFLEALGFPALAGDRAAGAYGGQGLFYDISALERGYRIVAFIVLGVILLAVSFSTSAAGSRPPINLVM